MYHAARFDLNICPTPRYCMTNSLSRTGGRLCCKHATLWRSKGDSGREIRPDRLRTIKRSIYVQRSPRGLLGDRLTTSTLRNYSSVWGAASRLLSVAKWSLRRTAEENPPVCHGNICRSSACRAERPLTLCTFQQNTHPPVSSHTRRNYSSVWTAGLHLFFYVLIMGWFLSTNTSSLLNIIMDPKT